MIHLSGLSDQSSDANIVQKTVANSVQSDTFNKPTQLVDLSGLRPVTFQDVARAFDVDTNFPGGCFDVVNAASKNTLGIRPDYNKSTKCWYGPDAQTAASEYAKRCCKNGIVFSKIGAWSQGEQPPTIPWHFPWQSNAVRVDPLTVVSSNGVVDYVTFNPRNNKYYDLNGHQERFGANEYDSPPHGTSGGAQIWCGICQGK
ncbi:MAG: hypothetical protein J0M35_17410 [Candidatus Obscuribacter phosphatis]|uniref:Uncharacterized protein n=1 Tax=Candidatus Obscuribacter phosphatis TaxID=1906157 RepID=A0A8J7TNT2_9BACT|nr:hypothetical protein [Candidatus Obscuribacter phosphatis]